MSKITITILGTTAGVPTKERAHTAIYLSYDDGEEFCYLLDCGEGTQRQMMMAGLNIMKIDQVLITHWHGDHCLGLPGLVDTMGFEDRQRPLEVFAPEAKRRIKRGLDFTYSMGRFKVVPRDVPARGKKVTKVLETGRFRVVSVPVKHGIPAVAYALLEKDKTRVDSRKAARFGLPEKGELYRIIKEKGKISLDGKRIRLEDISSVEKGKKVVFSGDTEICDNLKDLAGGADLLIQDCTYFAGMERKKHQHATLPEVLEMVRDAGVKRTILTHVSRKHRDAGELKELVKDHPGVEVAEDFMRVVT